MNSKILKRDFDYNLVKVLDAVISAGNATKASKLLSVTPAAVSLALNRLQLFYNEELFVRGKDGLIPTVKALEIHQSFRQAIELVSNAITPEENNQFDNILTILGGEIIESFYLSQLYDHKIFERYVFRHSSSKNLQITEMQRMLLTGHCDLIIAPFPFYDEGIECKLIDCFRHFCCICSSDSLLTELEQLSLHNFYSSRHAIYQSSLSAPWHVSYEHLFNGENMTYKGMRVKGYFSDSVMGIVNIVEKTSLIAVFPVKLAAFYKNQKNYAIEIIELPKEMTFDTINLYASWKRKNKRSHIIDEVVTMLHTLSSFRR